MQELGRLEGGWEGKNFFWHVIVSSSFGLAIVVNGLMGGMRWSGILSEWDGR